MKNNSSINVIHTIAIVFILFCFGCNTETDTNDGKIVLNYWEIWTGEEAKAMAAVVDKFNKSQDEIFVKFISTSELDRKVMLATAGGNPPDIAGIMSAEIPVYAENGALTPLDKFIEKSLISKKDYIPVVIEACEHHGFTWALPTTPASVALHYNKKMFREAGLDPNKPPKTITELEEMNKVLTQFDSKGHIKQMGHLPMEPGWWLSSFIYWFGGTYWDGVNHITATSKANQKCMEWIASYAERYGAHEIMHFRSGSGDFASPNNPFFREKVAMVLQGPWMHNFIKQYAEDDFEWGVAPFPPPESKKHPVTIVETNALIIPHGVKNPEASFRFLEFVSQQENLELLNLGQKKFSPLSKTSDSFYEKHPNPYIDVFIDLAKSPNAKRLPKLPNWTEYLNDMVSAVDDISNLRETPNEALAKVQKRQERKLRLKLNRWEKVSKTRLEEWKKR